jgi:four helix bundle protein
MDKPARLNHKDLILWQKSMNLAVRVYNLSHRLPRNETFGLVSQIRRAGSSIPSNIAEGSARKSTREFVHFLHIARGSMAELETHLMLAQRIGYLTADEVAETQTAMDEVGRILDSVLSGLARRLG